MYKTIAFTDTYHSKQTQRQVKEEIVQVYCFNFGIETGVQDILSLKVSSQLH